MNCLFKIIQVYTVRAVLVVKVFLRGNSNNIVIRDVGVLVEFVRLTKSNLKLMRVYWGGGGQGVQTSRLPYLAIPAPAPFFLASSLLSFFDCEILCNVA